MLCKLKKIIALIKAKSLSLFQRLKTLKNHSFKELLFITKDKAVGFYKKYYPKVKSATVRFIKNYITGQEGESTEQKLKRSMFHKISLAAVAVVLSVSMIVSMTAAWHTNVIQTSGLVFDVQKWGIDSSVSISDKLRNASPGAKGQIEVEINNTSDEIIDVGLSVGKVSLYNDVADMRKRLYFYIDDSVTSNGETTSRVYLNSKENYSYTVLPKHNLSIAKEGNGAPLMWEWVYDVVGYYFEGTVSDAGANITEYLRPLTYTVDNATFENDAVATVYGKPVMEYITEVSKTDGFEGNVTTKFTCQDGKVYYPVSVDEAGNGIWIYCNTLSEIEYENVVDTALANAQEQNRRFETMLSVVAAQKTLSVAEAYTEAQLISALTDDAHNMVVLLGDIKMSQPVAIGGGQSKIVDLAEHTLSTDLPAAVFEAKQGSSLTVMNGSMVANGEHTGTLITAEGSDVAISNVDISGVSDALRINDQNTPTGDSRVRITDSNINCSNLAIFVKGNGPNTFATSYLSVENSTIISTGYYGIVGNGNANTTGNWGTDIKIKNSTVEAVYSAIYHPQRASSLLIDMSVIRGLTPVVIKGGAAVINSSEIVATSTDEAAQMIQPPKLVNNGFADTGAGVYVETAYNIPCTVTLTGENNIKSRYSSAVLLFEQTNEKYQINIYGGTYSSDVSAFVGDGYVCRDNANGQFTVQKQ